MNILSQIRSNWVLRKVNYFFRSVVPLPLTAVEIETTTICNRKCSYCPNYTVGRPPRLMEENTFYKIIDSLKKYNFQGRISPHFYGEPLTDSRLEMFIRYAHTNLPKATIKLFTNGDLLTVERYLALKQAGVSVFRISQHSKDPSALIMNTLSVIKQNHPDLYTVEYLDYFNDHSRKLNRGGLVDVRAGTRHYCVYIDQLTFDYRGDAILCCNDYNASIVFGNIHDKDTNALWHDKRYLKARNMIYNGFWPYEICRICAEQPLLTASADDGEART